ncbi:MAG: hypothetical protein ACYC77_04655 [Coriobacteriia bacterium]
MRARVWWITGIVVAVFVTAGAVAFTGGDPSIFTPDGSLEDASAAAAIDPRDGVTTAPRVTDTVRLPGEITAKIDSDGEASLTPTELTEYERYLAETAEVVRRNASGLEKIVDVTVSALMKDDTAGLAAVWAPDEDVDTSYIESVAEAYPDMVSGDFQKTVNVAAVGDSTVYSAYAVVTWTDAGITSTHTLEVPVRFIGSQWYLTSIGSNTSGLTRVQTVRLP